MQTEQERIYKRAYLVLRMHALRNNAYLIREELPTLNLPIPAGILDDVLLKLQADGDVKISRDAQGRTVYDLLIFLERSLAESALDLPPRLELARIYLSRQMWAPAISELRMTQAHPKLKKDSLYLLGNCFEKKGAADKARECYERVLALDYSYQDTLTRLNRLSQKQAETVVFANTTILTAATPAALDLSLQNRYELVKELGRGGAGVVYQAVDYKLKRDVAIKLLHRQGIQKGDARNAFLQEARMAAQLHHQHIVEIYDVDTDAEFIAMEFVDGGSLKDLLIQHKRLPLEHAETIIKQLCHALHFAHQRGVLHRDIKPANIFITKKKQIKLGDFGIAHATQIEQNDFTQMSAQIGTLPYMSPEQVRGERLTPASDLYAVGIVLYEMLTGQPPFLAGDIAYHHLYTPPAPPGLSTDLDALMLRCLEKEPGKRFQSAEEFGHTLHVCLKDQAERFEKYRDLLRMAVIDNALTPEEALVLKLKRKALKLSDEDARRIEQEFGVNLEKNYAANNTSVTAT